MERAGVHNVTVMNTMGDRAGFKRRVQQVSKRATVGAGKKLATLSGRSGNRLITENPIG